MGFDVKTLQNIINFIPCDQAVLITGDHGLGKSQIVGQVAKERNAHFIDLRLGQCETGDVLGLPIISGGTMVFTRPWWWQEMEDCAKKNQDVVLFLDEINRANKDVLQAIFQLVLDREMQGRKIPSNVKTWIYAAANVGSNYDVNLMDPALFDRFRVIEFTPTVSDWLSWAESSVDVSITQFVAKNQGYLDPPSKTEEGKVYPSRRSWANLSMAIKAAEKSIVDPSNTNFLTLVAMTYVGQEAAIAYGDFVAKEFSQLGAEDVLERFKDVEAKLKDMVLNRLADVAILADGCVKELDRNRKAARVDNFAKFISMLPSDVMVSVWQKIMANSKLLDVAKKIVENETFKKKLAIAMASEF